MYFGHDICNNDTCCAFLNSCVGQLIHDVDSASRKLVIVTYILMRVEGAGLVPWVGGPQTLLLGFT